MPPEDNDSGETQPILTETTPDQAAQPVAPDDRAALMAAADAVLKGETPEGDKPAEAEKDAPPPAADDAMGKVARVLKEREAAQAARDEAGAAKAEAQAARAEIAALRAEAEKDRAAAAADLARVQKLRANPMAAIKELGWDTRQLVDEVTREGTPEWQAQKRYEAALEQQGAELKELKEWRASQLAASENTQKQAMLQGRQQAERSFLAIVPAESALRALYSDAEIVSKAHTLADEYHEKSKGLVASPDDLRDYLEEQAGQRLATIRGQRPGVGAAQQAAKVSATQPKANGPRALSASSASERRTSPKPRHEWTPGEERDAMKAAAEAAMRGTSS